MTCFLQYTEYLGGGGVRVGSHLCYYAVLHKLIDLRLYPNYSSMYTAYILEKGWCYLGDMIKCSMVLSH